MRRVLAKSLLPLVVLCASVACDGSRSSGSTLVTETDAAGDTIRIRITGELGAGDMHTLVPEMEVGAEDAGEEETFGWVVSLLPLKDGSVLVFDGQANALRQFDSTGTFVPNFGRKGGGPGEFGQVNGIARRADGSVVVWDATGGRINAYSDTGAFLSTWRVPMTGHFGQNMLWSDDEGRTLSWVVLTREEKDFTRGARGVIRYDAMGAVIDSVAYPVWREPPPTLLARTPDGRGSTSFTFPFAPYNVAVVSPGGGFVSGPGDPYVFYLTDRAASKPTRVELDFAPVAISETERREHRAHVEHGLRRTDPGWTWTVADIPQNKPAYESIQVGLDGRIWVNVSTPGVEIPAAELSPVPPGRESDPRFTTRQPTLLDVFTPEGRLLGRVAVPRRVAVLAMEGDHVYAVRSDSLDVPYVVRYRVSPALKP